MRQVAKLITLACALISAPLHAADYRRARIEIPGTSATIAATKFRAMGIDEPVARRSKGVRAASVTPMSSGLAGGYQYTSIDFPGSIWTAIYAINARGHIVGRYFDADDVSHSFVLRDGEFETIDYPDSAETLAARGINAAGEIVGNYVEPNGKFSGYLLRNGKFKRIRYPGVSHTLLSSINNAGDIVGLFVDDSTETGGTFIRNRDGTFRLIGVPWASLDIRSAQDNGRVMVGSADNADTTGAWRGFIVTGPDEIELVEHPDQQFPCSFLRYVNQAGEMVGVYDAATSITECLMIKRRGFLRRPNGRFKSLHFPGAATTDGFGINDDGVIVGIVEDHAGNSHGFKAEKTN
jgi:hypothetical protein